MGTRSATIVLAANQHAYCVFTNRTQYLTVNHTISPASGQDFVYTRCLGAVCADVALDGDAADPTTPSFAMWRGLAAGIYTLTVAPAEGWVLTTISCTTGEAVDLANRRVTIDLTGGKSTSCTFSHGAPPPSNDDFVNGRVIGSDVRSVLVDTAGATKESAEPYHEGFGYASVWYRWVPPGTGSSTMTTCGSNLDTVLAVYTGSAVGALTLVAANDDTAVCGGANSAMTFAVTGGVTYHISLSGWAGATGAAALNLLDTTAPLAIAPQSRVYAARNNAYSQVVTATGASPVTLSLSAGSLPPGLTFTPATGVLAGTPSTTAEYAFTIRATASGATTERDFRFSVRNPAVVLPGSGSVTEGNSGTTTLSITVTLADAVPFPVSAGWLTYTAGIPDEASQPSDYTAASGTVTFAPGATTASIGIQVNGDTTTEPNEIVVVPLVSLVNATLVGSVAAGAVINDDAQPVITPGATGVTEGNSGTVAVQVPVTLSNPSAVPITVSYATFDYAVTGAAVSGADYVATSGTVTFAPGETSKTVSITVLGDTIDEPPAAYGEWILIAFTNPTGGASVDLSFLGIGVGVIIDDDPPPVITPGGAGVVEGNSGSVVVQVPVTLSNPSAVPITVSYATFDYATPGAAVSGADYVATSGTVTFAPGETSKTVSITVLGDTLPEPPAVYGEWILVAFTNPTGGATVDLSFLGIGVGVIIDDD